jgi:hypothetical protein
MKTTVGALYEELYQSRTSLFTGNKEHFKCTPHELAATPDSAGQGPYLLRQPTDRERLGLKGIRAIANHSGLKAKATFSSAINSASKRSPSSQQAVHEPRRTQ